MADTDADRLQRLEDMDEIRQLYIDYGRHLDGGDIAAWASLFASNAKIRYGGVMRADGREEIQKMAEKLIRRSPGEARTIVHLIASPHITDYNGETAKGECVWAAVKASAEGPPHIPHIGRHADELVKENGRWRFALRRGILDVGAV